MSLYDLQRAIYEANRSAAVKSEYRENSAAFAAGYALVGEVADAVEEAR